MEQNNQHSKEDIVISIRDLHKSFGDLDVLKGIDLDLHKGENIAVLGRSGCGKSVLIKLIVGLLKQDKGEIMVFGQHVEKLDRIALDKLRLRIGFSFQSSALYDSMTVFENLAFPLTMNHRELAKAEVKTRVEETLEAVGLLDKINTLPAELSGGQRKRVGVARALIMKPEIMLYDEPTAGLDPITCGEINDLILDVNQKYNTSSIIITHDLTCAKMVANRVALLYDGQFVRTGNFQEVFGSEDDEAKHFFNYNFIR